MSPKTVQRRFVWWRAPPLLISLQSGKLYGPEPVGLCRPLPLRLRAISRSNGKATGAKIQILRLLGTSFATPSARGAFAPAGGQVIHKGAIMESMSKPNSTSNMQDATERASAAAHNTVDQVADAARPAVDRLAAGAHQTVDKLAGAAGAAAEMMGVKGEQIKLAQERLLEDCRGYVRENPLASIGIALAAGYLLSRLTSR